MKNIRIVVLVLIITTVSNNVFSQEYCIPEKIKSNDEHYIFNVKLAEINNFSYKNANEYTYYNNTQAQLTPGDTYELIINGIVTLRDDYYLKVFIDYNNDGEFSLTDEVIYADTGKEKKYTFFNRKVYFTVPNDAVKSTTRMRVILKNNHDITDPCNLDREKGEVEDYPINIAAKDNSPNQNILFSQVYHTNTDKWIEITNTSNNTLAANTYYVHLFKNAGEPLTNKTPDASYRIPYEIRPHTSLLIRNSMASLQNYVTNPIVEDAITNFNNNNDVLIISSTKNSEAWTGRVDVLTKIENNSSKIRLDYITVNNAEFLETEWINFVDDNLNPYRDVAQGGPERHPHAPVISEVNNADTNSNTLLGLHYVDKTSREDNAWTNGNPDKSRTVNINENYTTIYRIQANSLEVKANTKLTLKDELLVLMDTLTLHAGAEIRLAEESQMIQIHNHSRNVVGNGKIYIDQKSEIASVYRYNYLGSPVVSIDSDTYFIADVLKDGSDATSENSIPLDIQFVSGYDGAATSPISIASYWLYIYTNGDGELSNWTHKGPHETINPTDGFTLKGPGVAQNYTFVGSPNDGELTTTIGGYQSYLVANPYPSALSAKKFIEDNMESLDGTLYFWEHADVEKKEGEEGHHYNGYVGGYGTRNIAMGLSANKVASNDNEDDNTPSLGDGAYKEPKEYIAVGQGFFVSSDVDGGTIVFNNSQREYKKLGDESVFFKVPDGIKQATVGSENYKNNTLPILKLGMDYLNKEGVLMHRQIGISFKEQHSFDYDNGYDSQIFDLNDTDVYWKFPNNDQKYIIAGVQELSDRLEIPLSIQVGQSGNLNFTIDEWQAIDKDVFIKDKLTNQSYKINDTKATLFLDAGTYEERFVLTFTSNTLKDDNLLPLEDALTIYYNNETIVIENPHGKTIQSSQLYSTTGQQVQNWKPNSSDNKIVLNLHNRIAGIYIISTMVEGKKVSKKIWIS